MKLSPLFPLGRLVATQNVLNALPLPEIEVALSRHSAGDWGDLGAEDKALNDQSVLEMGRIISAYVSRSSSVRFWIVTEADRSATTVLLPSDY